MAKSSNNPCKPRRRFARIEAARAAAANIANRQGRHVLPEPCGRCNAWHLAEVR